MFDISAELKCSAKPDAPILCLWRSMHMLVNLKSRDFYSLMIAVPKFKEDSIFSLFSSYVFGFCSTSESENYSAKISLFEEGLTLLSLSSSIISVTMLIIRLGSSFNYSCKDKPYNSERSVI